MKCLNCGNEMTHSVESIPYALGGLPNVNIDEVGVDRCSICGEEEISIRAMEVVHATLAHEIRRKKGRLLPDEIRFLRKHLGFNGVQFAEEMGVNKSTVSRWENGSQEMGPTAEKVLRSLVAKKDPIDDYRDLMTSTTVDPKTSSNLHLKVHRWESATTVQGKLNATSPSEVEFGVMGSLQEALRGVAEALGTPSSSCEILKAIA